jgi:GNAT superfamily N-acetyltransferase
MRRADSADDVLDVLNEAARWLAAQEIRQWPAAFPAEYVTPSISAGCTWLARVDGIVRGTLALTWSDPLWLPDDGNAGYVHRLAIRRPASGLGAWLLQWAAAEVARVGRSRLRLDCVASNTALRSYYESLGFRHRGDIREDDGPRAVLSRYQKAVS